jgi:hypothetical protein
MPDHQLVWHPEVLPEGWARAAGDLAARSVLDGFYLSGDTGLALHFGHRRSVDLDLFGGTDFDPAALQTRLAGLQSLTIRRAARGPLHLVLHGVLVSFLHFPYPLLFSPAPFHPLAVADPRDIAGIKVNAIATRGHRRDFVDVYVAAQRYGLGEILRWFDAKFASTPYDRVHILKALVYFKDAEEQPMPDMLAPLDWSEVTRFFVSEVPRLARPG